MLFIGKLFVTLLVILVQLFKKKVELPVGGVCRILQFWRFFGIFTKVYDTLICSAKKFSWCPEILLKNILYISPNLVKPTP